MTELEDPMKVYRESLARVPVTHEEHPPRIARAEVWPYPDLVRLWVRVETTPFATFPNLALVVLDPDEVVVSQMFMVEIRQPYQSLTMHLRREPRPGERYRLAIEIERDDVSLDRHQLEFDLVYVDPSSRPAPRETDQGDENA